ncbi:MAG: aminotransferase class III-fold pyridoxal phosphate-dependent enzyme [Saprospiraceae bacterium]|nr:aminotransferase class III-fold pyridoxal phosphate-dependent enzyme [Saprospiraceae bacterium]MCF8251800.1 aminotransferase class III-fold pyridoxal phosphate-dependent enzyme [Saprospiraceae bacterium]MCF8281454.1 aminotransferase class III-fold pyridoxal phosphate-dependent enzyme [Bacteroidales bacterium]MCF8313514.1 aminotransferase class III-fold pyridoxal phosphate-dependent enzyme [Saprospiraceae bacterium]MCF8442263.1 aminotransferase class III-fold pyridoxal phosphate-dependent enz
MTFTSHQIATLAAEHFNLSISAEQLPGEIDLNFLAKTPTGEKYNLKIAHPDTNREYLEFQNALMARLNSAGLGLKIPQVVPSVSGETITSITAPDGSLRLMRLLTWVEGRCFAEVNPHSPDLLEKVGELCGKLSRALEGFDHPAAHRFLKWDASQAGWTGEFSPQIEGDEKQALAQYFYQLFEKNAVPLLPQLRQSVCYNDANDYNILVSHDPENLVVPGVIDFGDAVFTHTVNELAIACAYAAMHKPDPLAAISHLAKGYHRQFPLTEPEAEALFPLTIARLLISVTCSAMNLAENPGNEYLQISDRPAWDLLKKLREIPPALAHATVRHACGWEPCPQNAAFMNWVNGDNFPKNVAAVIGADLNEAIWLDLSVGSQDLGNYANLEDPEKLQRRIMQVLAESGKPQFANRPIIGRYDEARPFYTTDAYAVNGNDGPEWRTVHIGLDIFAPPGTPVQAPVAGTVHSFQDNASELNYGPTIILEHRVSPTLTFFTLYGHLSRKSLESLEVGQKVRAGEAFCQIGPMPENGNWPPHLHLQVMLDMMGWQGDFTGVVFPEKKTVWKSICPDPWLLLFGQPSPPPPVKLAAGEILQFRQRHLGKNLSVSYQNPLNMRRGWRQYLFDETGRRYLDTVNNVAHVGHEHPRVVRAGQRQMAVLNTNTRYLHENIVRFSEELLATFPPELDVAFIVNSGSEANELAMRLAKNFTQQKDMLVVEVGYHGNTQGCVDVSSYKFEGPGGKGAPPHVHVMPMPDVYRGIYRGNTKENGLKYAAHLGEAAQKIKDAGRGVAAFLCESVISCGGQVPLPTGYLAEAAKQIRSFGGLLIADEVQTGCGRHGEHFWAFEEHGVVPDIVTVGKPIGNGHPLGVVVTTRAIADAFANGMEYFNTFGGNPVSCAIGLEVLRVIKDEGLQENAREIGGYLRQGLHELANQFPIIGDVRGPGLFLGIELVKDRGTLTPAAAETAYLANRMRELGILMSTDGPFHNVLKIKPPIIFSKMDADFLLEMLEKVFGEDRMRVG